MIQEVNEYTAISASEEVETVNKVNEIPCVGVWVGAEESGLLSEKTYKDVVVLKSKG